MDSSNHFYREVDRDSAVQQSPTNPVAEELDELELEAIAGGYFDYDYLNWTAAIVDNSGFDPRIYGVVGVAGKKVG
ncbi:hypothetical protein [Microcoleus sp. F4-D5]|uniref:hypothetical protein n=1 Tax=Microcoleus sp. F4-D5 TaxID=2818760 RepID=UPI002FD026DB